MRTSERVRRLRWEGDSRDMSAFQRVSHMGMSTPLTEAGMSPILRTILTIVATLMLTGCDDPGRLLAPSAPRTSLGDGSSAGSMIAFRSIEARCGWEIMAGCDGDEENGWGWTTWSGLATVDADGTGLVNVTYMVEDNTLSRLVMPAWSPDGMRIACQDGSAIMVVAGAGGTPLNLTRYPSNDGHATWSPDGSRIAFSANRYVYTMAADGSNPTLVARGSSPSWRPTDAPLPPIQLPVARITALGCLELTCTFDGTGSTDDVGTRQVSHQWSSSPVLGISSASTWKQSFPKAGTYTVALTVTAWATGKIATTTQAVTVTGLPAGAPPVAGFTTSCAGLTCTLDGRGSTDDAAIVSYSWNIGNAGETATGAVVHAIYPSEGSRTVVLTVTDGAGQTSSTTRTLYAAPIPGDAPPVARVSVACVGLQCDVSASGSMDDRILRRTYIDLGTPGSTPI